MHGSCFDRSCNDGKSQAAACQEYSAAIKPYLMQSSVLGRIPAAATSSIMSTGPSRSASLALHEDKVLSLYCTLLTKPFSFFPEPWQPLPVQQRQLGHGAARHCRGLPAPDLGPCRDPQRQDGKRVPLSFLLGETLILAAALCLACHSVLSYAAYPCAHFMHMCTARNDNLKRPCLAGSASEPACIRRWGGGGGGVPATCFLFLD